MSERLQISLGVVTQAYSVLLVERATPEQLQDGSTLSWAFPGGKKNSGEGTEEACVREVAEETGYSVRILRLIEAGEHQSAPVDVSYWHCELVSSDTKEVTDTAIKRSRWVPIDFLDLYLTSPLNEKVADYLAAL
jgi:8-oxo-dGTP diphosphatase